MSTQQGVLSVSGSGVAVSEVEATGRENMPEFRITLIVTADAPLGERTMTFTGAAGTTATGTIRVTAVAPKLSAITPNSFVLGTTTAARIDGANFVGETSIREPIGEGVHVVPGSVVVQNDRTLVLRIAVDATAPLGYRTAVLTGAEGVVLNPDVVAESISLLVLPPVPTITRVSPASALPGAAIDVEIIGTGFVPRNPFEALTFLSVIGDGISVSNVQVPVSATNAQTSNSMSARLAVAQSAVPGPRTLRVTTTGGAADATFTIAPPLRPRIGRFTVSPSILRRGRVATLSWSDITGATLCTITPGVGDVSCAGGTRDVQPLSTTEYQLDVRGPGGRDWDYATVTVEDPPSGNASAHGPAIPVVPRSK